MQFCLRPGCSRIVQRGYCPRHDPGRDANRANAVARRWYRSDRWKALRRIKLRQVPRCPGFGQWAGQCGRPTTDVDHRQPHRGDPALFWDDSNLDAYCHQCHAIKTGQGR